MTQNTKHNNRIKRNDLYDYLLSCIDLSGYDEKYHSLKNDAAFAGAYEIFMLEKHWEVERLGIHQACESWLAGLCSAVSVDWTNYDILKVADMWGLNLNTEKKKDDFLMSWFKRLATALVNFWQNESISRAIENLKRKDV